jgi:hypothetical protein
MHLLIPLKSCTSTHLFPICREYPAWIATQLSILFCKLICALRSTGYYEHLPLIAEQVIHNCTHTREIGKRSTSYYEAPKIVLLAYALFAFFAIQIQRRSIMIRTSFCHWKTPLSTMFAYYCTTKKCSPETLVSYGLHFFCCEGLVKKINSLSLSLAS